MNITAKTISTWIAPWWARYEGTDYLNVARELKQRESMSLDERLAEQWGKLQAMVRYAWEHCSYYRRRFRENGFEPGDLKGWDSFRTFPLLTKQDIRDSGRELFASGVDPKALISRKTSGSTGESLHFFVTEKDCDFKRGVSLYRDQWTGWRLGDWKAMVWGNPSYLDSWRDRLRNALIERRFSLDTLKMDEAMMMAFAQQILRKKPTMLFGHAHSLYLFARFWEMQGLQPYRFRGILSTAMVLHEHERKTCEEVFDTPVFDRYGCEEVSLIASECQAHLGLHVNTDSLVVEVVKNGAPATSGEEGAVVVTDLCNRTMPFIRYLVGDMAIPTENICPCGRSYPRLSRVTGRIADYLRTPEGHWVSGISLTENFATLIPGLEKIQIVQEKMNEIRLRIIPGPRFDDQSRAAVQRLVTERFGTSMRYEIEIVSQILAEPSGKYRFSICRLTSE